MKKIFFNKKEGSDSGVPFWQPWGFGRYIGKVLLFLAMLIVLLLLISMLHRCSSDHNSAPPAIPPEWQADPPDGPDHRGAVPIEPQPADIPNIESPNLPSPPNNRLQPVDPRNVVDDEDGVRRIVNDKLNVILNSDANDETFKRWSEEFKSAYPSDEYYINFYDDKTKLIQITVPPAQRAAVLRDLPTKITDISFRIFAEEMMTESATFNDPVFNEPRLNWFYKPIQAYEAWDITQGSPDIVIAIVDSYFDLNHDELNSERLFKAYSVVTRDGNVAPVAGIDEGSFMHGTMVATLAAGNADNNKGFAGIAPKCRVMPISMGHTITAMRQLQGILYAIYQGANVINISSGSYFSDAVHRMTEAQQVEASRSIGTEAEDVWGYVFQLANERNVTIVWAAGNQDLYTGLDASKRNDNTVRVSALGIDLKKAEWSNYGNISSMGVTNSTISAPGEQIVGAQPYNAYTVSMGTSFSAPIVAGAVALIKSVDPTLTNEQIIKILKETGKPVPGGNTIGPMLQIRDALQRVRSGLATSANPATDHSNLLGLWQTVDMLRSNNIEDGRVVPTGDYNRQYFNITSSTTGQIIVYEATSSKKDFTAPLNVSWNSDGTATLQQTAKATAPGSSSAYIPNTFTLKFESDGHVHCTATSSYGTAEYYLKKIERRMDS